MVIWKLILLQKYYIFCKADTQEGKNVLVISCEIRAEQKGKVDSQDPRVGIIRVEGPFFAKGFFALQ